MSRKRRTQKFKITWMNKSVVFEIRELIAMVLGFLLAYVLVSVGEVETGKTIALALTFYGIGRSAK